MPRQLSPEDRVTYLPSSDEEFRPETVRVFRRVVADAVELYIERHAREELPVSLMDFALAVVYDVGHRDAVREIASAEGTGSDTHWPARRA